MSEPHIVILGLMGVGKSTTGRALAAALGWPYADSDVEIERLVGEQGRELAATSGVEALHRIEMAVLLGALARQTPHVITAAASVVEDDLVLRILPRRAHVVLLMASTETVLGRQADGEHRRVMARSELETLAARRQPLFQQVADQELEAQVSTDILVSEIVVGLPADLYRAHEAQEEE